MNVLSPIRQGEEAERLAPWGLEPGRLWSLWDMIRSYAWQFYLLSQFVGDIARDLDKPISAVPGLGGGIPTNLLASPNALSGLGALAQISTDEWLTQEERERIVSILDLVQKCCADIKILTVSGEFQRITSCLTYTKKAEVLIHITHLKNRISDELQYVLFLNVPPEKVKYYKAAELFGHEVGRKLPKTTEDIQNAGNCYALGQSTACVFHLMRVMEYCVQHFGAKLKVKIEINRCSWYEIMDHVNNAIKPLPGGPKATAAQRRRKQALSMAASRLDHVRIVWRNDVMHPKATYDEAEALEVLESVRAFVVNFVELV